MEHASWVHVLAELVSSRSTAKSSVRGCPLRLTSVLRILNRPGCRAPRWEFGLKLMVNS